MKYFVVSKVWEGAGEREKGIALTELKSKSKAVNKLGQRLVWNKQKRETSTSQAATLQYSQ